MPLRLEIKKTLSARSERVKSVEFHPSEPWVLCALYSGNVVIWDHNTQSIVRQVEVCSVPIRTARFVVRKQWIVAGADDMSIRVFNSNTMEKVKALESAHTDYIRCLSVHPSLPLLLSCSDDMTIKSWDWDRGWASQTFEGHVHYVMMAVWSPKDPLVFASGSLDRTLKVWTLAAGKPSSYTLSGHSKGVNCVEFSPYPEKPYLLSGSDDKSVKVWDLQTRQCLHTLDGHSSNVTAAVFHPSLPVIISGAEDGLVKIWHSGTYRLEQTLNYAMERCWGVGVVKGGNSVALAFDEGTIVLRLGTEEPVVSWNSGKAVFSKGNEILTANLKGEIDSKDGELVIGATKEMGSTEIYPQKIIHHPSGRLFAVVGDGEWVVYTAQALRNKNFGSGLDFVWSFDGSRFATRDASGRVRVFFDFKEVFSFKPDFVIEEIFGGPLLSVKGAEFICFFDWEHCNLIRRIDEAPDSLIWGDGVVAMICPETTFLLKYDSALVSAALVGGAQLNEDDGGLENAFELISEISEKVCSSIWIGSDESSAAFLYVSGRNKLNVFMGGFSETIAHLDRPMTVLGYLAEQSRIYLLDRNLEIVSFTLDANLLAYQTAILGRNFQLAEAAFSAIPESLYTRAARFLEKQGFQSEALEISRDSDHRLELALGLGRLEEACKIVEIGEGDLTGKWRMIGDRALEVGNIKLAKNCFLNGNDPNSLFLLGSSVGDIDAIKNSVSIADSNNQYNASLYGRLLLGDVRGCVELLAKAGKYAEACLFARTYCPEETSAVFGHWKSDLQLINKNLADALIEPINDSKKSFVSPPQSPNRDHQPETQIAVPAPEQMLLEREPPEVNNFEELI